MTLLRHTVVVGTVGDSFVVVAVINVCIWALALLTLQNTKNQHQQGYVTTLLSCYHRLCCFAHKYHKRMHISKEYITSSKKKKTHNNEIVQCVFFITPIITK